MKTTIKTGLLLFFICAFSAGLCGIINSITAPQILINTQKETEAALSAVSGGYALGDEMESSNASITMVIPLLDGDDKVAGYILELNANGYGGGMTIIASYLNSGELMKAKMMANSETPGLGKKSENDWYMAMFEGLGGASPLPTSKADLPSDQAQSVSGASITFSGVSGALNLGSSYVKGLGGAL